jgi:hypothetical protein
VDHWLHDHAIPDELPLRERMNHHEPEDLHGDVRDLDQSVLNLMVAKMKDDQRKRDGWMDDQN